MQRSQGALPPNYAKASARITGAEYPLILAPNPEIRVTFELAVRRREEYAAMKRDLLALGQFSRMTGMLP